MQVSNENDTAVDHTPHHLYRSGQAETRDVMTSYEFDSIVIHDRQNQDLAGKALYIMGSASFQASLLEHQPSCHSLSFSHRAGTVYLCDDLFGFLA